MPDTTNKLSQAQRRLLRNLLRYLEHVRANGNANAVREATNHGVPLSWLRPRGRHRSDADRASFSRAVARLEARGLVIRSNVSTGIPPGHSRSGYIRTSLEEPAPRRADHLILTPLGKDVAKRLT